ncbi:two-component sensor histidine kinase [Bacteroides sp. 214]|uniref:sensor histidine kinase n=1 Tax=Bacteroides sp. 214 TaxID=2302935 RepID=UPI0013D4FBB1|nr:ATP-binding protein [Bacteroides sp. 214]NDW11333.1 two-component sensor histidine kinase [Bacteroides sp. 214]
MQPKPSKQFFSYGRRLFFSVALFFLLFCAYFVTSQYYREIVYQEELISARLQDFNNGVRLEMRSPDFNMENLPRYVSEASFDYLRVTIMDFQGNVIYDCLQDDSTVFENQARHKEVQDAIKGRNGYTVKRQSKHSEYAYFYSATSYKDIIIRSALAYTPQLKESLDIDETQIWVTLIIIIILITVFYQYTRRLGESVTALQTFVSRIERNEPLDDIVESDLPANDELSEIARQVIEMYKRLLEVKNTLFVERDKLIKHLQSLHEGLGAFTKEKKEVIANNLFMQYINLISDANLENSEGIFSVVEFQTVTDFIDSSQKKPIGKDGKQINYNIHKNGRIFTVFCTIFQNRSFEVSINDVTREEEQIELKRQITQNIAHELKTPVSSIQAYLETIVSTEDMPKEKMQQFLQKCYEQSNRLSRLLRDISMLNRMSDAADMFEKEPINIAELVGKIFEESALELEKKQITAINQLNNEVEIMGNQALMYSIFRNLTDNAIAYGGQEISIIVTCFREDETHYYISFADTGMGVGTGHMQRLFERFYRIDKGRSRKMGGTGLGLAIVKNAILIHGGQISVKKYKNGGLEFIFTLAKEK